MSIDSIGMSRIPACSWGRAEYSLEYRSRFGEVVVELTSGEARILGVKRGKLSRIVSKAKCQETTTKRCAKYRLS